MTMLPILIKFIPEVRHRFLISSGSFVNTRNQGCLHQWRRQHSQQHTSNSSYSSTPTKLYYLTLALGSISVGYILSALSKDKPITEIHLATETNHLKEVLQMHLQERKDLPTFQLSEVESHSSTETGVWIVYGKGVYDITNYIPNHPGAEQIMLGAGSSVDPFWVVYQQHIHPDVLQMLEKFRIGNLASEDIVNDEDIRPLWSNEPKRHQNLKPIVQRPFNGESIPSQLIQSFYTPNEIFYVRNHLPVPNIDPSSYTLEIEIETTEISSTKSTKTLTLDQIKELPKHTITATLMCGGNRRLEMFEGKKFFGPPWGPGAVGNAKWTGVKLRDILLSMGVQPKANYHVCFEGADLDPTSNPYGASIPLAKALDEHGCVMIAYEMNGKPLPPDHGYPVRVIVPGHMGGRSVKWLTRITISENESESHWQKYDYKGFNPNTSYQNVDYSKSPAIQAMPVTSAICTPAQHQCVKVSADGCITVRGYAWSGGGRRIVRVDLSGNRGKTWQEAKLDQEDQPDGLHYGWSLWSAHIPVTKNSKGEAEIWAKAVDSAYNVQPESFANIFNFRGVLANAYHRIKINIV